MAKQTITEHDVALALARRSEVTEYPDTAHFAEQYTPSNLQEILHDGKEALDLGWCVKRYLQLWKAKATPAVVKKACIDEVRQLVMLGVLQTKTVSESLPTTKGRKFEPAEDAPALADPFKLKVAQ